MNENRPQISRRRVIAGAGVGAAALWVAPAVTTLGSAGAAGSCIKGASAWKFVAAEVNNRALSGTSLTGAFQTPTGTLTVTQGDVDFVGTGTGYGPPTYPAPICLDLTGGSGVTVTTMVGAALAAGAYIVELDVFGSIPGDAGGNSAVVSIGASSMVNTGNIGDTTASPFFFSGGGTVIGGALSIVHTSTADFRGLFLQRLEVFSADCQ